MSESENLCLENLDEFVNDDNKRVTYKWLSRSLSMHVNTAKQLLYKFVDQQRNKKENDTLSVTYALSGLLEENGSQLHKVQIIPEERLETAKAAYKVLTSCHIYSVQKGPLKDTNTLYMTNYALLKENLQSSNQHSAIQYAVAVPRSEDEMTQFAQAKASNTPQPSAVKQNGSVLKPKVEAAKSKKPAGIAGMFSQAASKPSKDSNIMKSSDQHEVKPAPKEEKPKATKQGGVMSFFGKQAAKPKTEKKTDSSNQAATQESASSSEPKTSPAKVQNKKSPEGEKNATQFDSKRGIKHKDHSEDEDTKGKRRKRIKVLVESSSSEDEVDMESPIPSPAPPEPDREPQVVEETDTPSPASVNTPSPVPSPKKRPATEDNDMCGKIKKRKLVSKTFVNDEGFMVTEKVYEDEWVDAPEEPKKSPEKTKKPTEPTKAKKTTPTKKTSPNTKQSGKQTSLMTFFKKK